MLWTLGRDVVGSPIQLAKPAELGRPRGRFFLRSGEEGWNARLVL